MKPNRLLLLVLLCIATTAAFSQQNFNIYFRQGPQLPEANIRPSYIDSFNLAFTGKQIAIIQFWQVPTEIEKKILSASQIELLHYIPELSYTVSIGSRLSFNALVDAKVRSVFIPSAAQKMDDFLGKGWIPSWAVKSFGTVDVLASFLSTLSTAQVVAELEKHSAEVISTDKSRFNILHIRVSRQRLPDIASLPFIEYLQVAPPEDQVLNSNSRYGARANVLNAPIANGGKGLNGEGVVIGVGDNADIQTHADFSGRLINRSSLNPSGHGHHVSGIAAGAGNLYELYAGFAPKATIIKQGFSNILDHAGVYVQDHGMVITNNSYGNIIECEYHGIYDLYSRALDQMAFDYPYLSNVFAAGNSGHTTCEPFDAGYHTVLGGYQSAKNVISVGASTDSGMVAFFSSRGPVADGRIKPEITAMGQYVISAWPTNSYSYNSGTSMAAPAVSGGLALLYQRYRQLHGGADPKNGLMKAILTNGATDNGNKGPDYQNGFGWMNLLRSVDMIEKNRFFTSSVNQGSSNNHNITVPANTAKLKVMLYWNDPAGSLFTKKALVNDLDLQVISSIQSVTLPLILDTAKAGLNNLSITGVDRVNNMEQVVIDLPAAGNYTLRVNGTAINQNNTQEYFLVYDLVPVELKIVNPVEGMALLPSVQNRINWESHGFSSGTADLDLSVDDGTTWTSIATGVDINRPTFSWWTPAVAAEKARIRITKNGSGETSVSGAFTILDQPVISLDAVQCEGYININWTAVTGATAYEVMLLREGEMKVIATTTNTSYSYSGLSKDSLYFVSVRAKINNGTGFRATAVSRRPDGGSCAGNISDNDLRMEAIISPLSGRKLTSTDPGPQAVVSVRIKNLDDAPASSFEIKYSLNGGAWVTENINAAINGGGTYVHSFAVTADLSAVGNYSFVAVVNNAAGDPVKKNDTAYRMVKILPNAPVDLTGMFIDNFETALAGDYLRDTTGLNGIDRYDFSRTAVQGRLRPFINSGIAYSGSKTVTLDTDRFTAAGNTNFLTGTFNLSNYSASTHDLRLDFQYLNHGQSAHANNKVWARGSDSDPWVEVYDLFQNQSAPGAYKKTQSIEIANLLALVSQNFGSSFQVRWGQYGTRSATDRLGGGGYSFDDIRLYNAVNDLQLRSIDEPVVAGCNLSSVSQVKISVRNSSRSVLNNVPVKYRINNGNWITENIPSIAAGATIQYSFTATADLSQHGNYTVTALVDFASDNFRDNDTLSKQVRNLPLVSSFPYLQNFEAGDGHWYAGGTRSSWQYGMPASYKIKSAASGNRAWKTRLQGAYNSRELSYLYSPCFNISSMTVPTLSFSVALDIEDCGNTICDAAWVEYSTDGITWTRLGTTGSGTNWYNKPSQTWSIDNYTRWHVATTALPTGLANIRFRFVFSSDEGLEKDGMAIDDIHIYDNIHGIYGSGTTTGITNNVNGNNWVNFLKDGKLVASVQPKNQNLGATEVGVYIFNGEVRSTNNQYYHNRNITIQPTQNAPADSVRVRFYFLDTETEIMLAATGCNSCEKPESAYNLGVSQYSDPVKTFENGTIADNQQGLWNFISSNALAIVPFDRGYYAEFSVAGFSEFWLSNGGFEKNAPLPVKLLKFNATKTSSNDVLLQWQVGAEDNVDRYEIELARGNADLLAGLFQKIGEVVSQGNTTGLRDYSFTDDEPGKMGARFYRLKIINQNGSFAYSPVRSVVFDDPVLWSVYPNPSSGMFFLMYQLNAGAKLNAVVYDAKGRRVKQFRENGSGFAQKATVDLTGMPAGIYLLSIEAGEMKYSFKLYKQ